MTAVLSAGGQGTRLGALAAAVPKPMVLLAGVPVLEHQLRVLSSQGIQDVILLIGHLGNVIVEYFGSGEKFGVKIRYIHESRPLGTAGALALLKGQLEDTFLFAYGDIVFDIDLKRFLQAHKAMNADCTLATHPNSHPFDSDVVVVATSKRVTKILKKKEPRIGWYKNRVNAGIFLVSPKLLEMIEDDKKSDFEQDVIVPNLERLNFFAYDTTEYMKDMGTVERLLEVEEALASGLVGVKNLALPQKAVFLDRDGTVNKYVGLLASEAELEVLPGAAEAIKRLNRSEYLCFIVTNQPVIARGLCTPQELDEIHNKLETELGLNGAYLDGIVYCPHHPDKGYEGEVQEYKIDCECRKPRIGMLMELSNRYNIDLTLSWVVGDTTSDIQLASNAGCRSILVATGVGGTDGKYSAAATRPADDLLGAVDHILSTKDSRNVRL